MTIEEKLIEINDEIEIRKRNLQKQDIKGRESLYPFCMWIRQKGELEELAEWLEKLKTVENIMLTYNANWYADEDDGVPDCEVLESIWNVLNDDGLDIDIEQDYRKGKKDGYLEAINDIGYALDKIEMCVGDTWLDFYKKALKTLCKLKNTFQEVKVNKSEH